MHSSLVCVPPLLVRRGYPQLKRSGFYLDWRTKLKRIVITLLLAVMSMPAFAAQEEKVDICHFDLDYGAWKLISISDNAVESHFNNHDDGLPDGQTLGTTTLLSDDCEPVEPLLTCPCWDTYTESEMVALMNRPFSTTPELTRCSSYYHSPTLRSVSFFAGNEEGTLENSRFLWARFEGVYHCGLVVTDDAEEPDINNNFNSYGDAPLDSCASEGVAIMQRVEWCP